MINKGRYLFKNIFLFNINLVKRTLNHKPPKEAIMNYRNEAS